MDSRDEDTATYPVLKRVGQVEIDDEIHVCASRKISFLNVRRQKKPRNNRGMMIKSSLI